ncbi:hypothetical protein I4U23_022436 [Adineta vaga]|nr:hypothetical protein I4U23_022436 [Adineta vaga]
MLILPSNGPKQPSFPNIIKRFGEQIVLIIYNLSRHMKGLKMLRKEKSDQQQLKISFEELEDPWEYIAPAIKSATIIIILASSFYANSNYNRQELTYTL